MLSYYVLIRNNLYAVNFEKLKEGFKLTFYKKGMYIIMEFENYDKKMNIELNGFIENGKQFDIDVKVPKDNRNVVFGTVRDDYGDPIKDAVVKLIEVEKMLGKEERKPVSHTFTNENGEFLFGPICPNKNYDIQIWVDRVKHVKICRICKPKKQDCLKGEKEECKKDDFPVKPREEDDYCPLLDK